MTRPGAPVALTGSVLLCDAGPWYAFDLTGVPRLRELWARHYSYVLGPDDLRRGTAQLVGALRPGDVVLLPSMGGALMRADLEAWAHENGGEIFPLPSSRHPYVSLALDSRDTLHATCRAYAESARTLMDGLADYVRRWIAERRRLVLIDANSATGRDVVLMERWLAAIVGYHVDIRFMVLVEELSTQSAVGGNRGRRVREPDRSAIRLADASTRFLSHLAFLARYDEEQRFRLARDVREHAPIMHFWDIRPDSLLPVHAYETSPLRIHRERLHLRASSTEGFLEQDAQEAWERIAGWSASVGLRPRGVTSRSSYFLPYP